MISAHMKQIHPMEPSKTQIHEKNNCWFKPISFEVVKNILKSYTME